jgi:putative transposase
MSRKGDCWDNAVAESFFATLKRELEGIDAIESRTAATISIVGTRSLRRGVRFRP